MRVVFGRHFPLEMERWKDWDSLDERSGIIPIGGNEGLSSRQGHAIATLRSHDTGLLRRRISDTDILSEVWRMEPTVQDILASRRLQIGPEWQQQLHSFRLRSVWFQAIRGNGRTTEQAANEVPLKASWSTG